MMDHSIKEIRETEQIARSQRLGFRHLLRVEESKAGSSAAIMVVRRMKAAAETGDALRLPGETLAFVGVKPGMVVAELFPAGGYYTRTISDVVGPKGKVYGIENAKWDKGEDAKMAAEPGHANVSIQLVKFGEFNLPQKVDLFWTTQNYHDLHVAEYGNLDIAAFNKHVYDALKPGGIYFILDHQANPGTNDAQIAKVHRIEKSQVIREVTAAGFKLVGEGNALHRPADDHTKMSSDPAIKGHTDQFMLKFQKV